MTNPYQGPAEGSADSLERNEPWLRIAADDLLGSLLIVVPPLVTLLAVFVPVNLGVIGTFAAGIVAFDAFRWKLPRWLWVPLVFVFWPLTIPAYVYVRSQNGSRIHWLLGLASMGAIAGLVGLGVALGSFDYLFAE